MPPYAPLPPPLLSSAAATPNAPISAEATDAGRPGRRRLVSAGGSPGAAEETGFPLASRQVR